MLPVNKRIGIVGTRCRNTSNDLCILYKKFIELYENGDTIVSGGCPNGADKFAEIIARRVNIPIEIYYPDKSNLDLTINPKWAYAKIAYARNTLIADNSDILIAMISETRKGGTEDTIKKFLKKKRVENLYLI